jgi:hypothetical protein
LFSIKKLKLCDMKKIFLIIIPVIILLACPKVKKLESMKGFTIMRKEIDIEKSPVLFNDPVTPENFKTDWNTYNSQWWVEDGWLTGKNPENAPGMAILKEDFPGNVMVEFEARTVIPSSHDIDVMWNGEWVDSLNHRGMAYVAGIEGWWEGKAGLEKSPEYKLTATTPLFDFKPGHSYKVLAGSIEGHMFIFVDGKLLLELTDPDPIDNTKYVKVGFEAYCSYIQIRNIVIRQIKWNKLDMKYDPEF